MATHSGNAPMEGYMERFEQRGWGVRELAKGLFLDYMRCRPECQPGQEGIRLARIFRDCGLGWGDQPKATESHQQYWGVAIMRTLEAEGLTERVGESGPWRLR